MLNKIQDKRVNIEEALGRENDPPDQGLALGVEKDDTRTRSIKNTKNHINTLALGSISDTALVYHSYNVAVT